MLFYYASGPSGVRNKVLQEQTPSSLLCTIPKLPPFWGVPHLRQFQPRCCLWSLQRQVEMFIIPQALYWVRPYLVRL